MPNGASFIQHSNKEEEEEKTKQTKQTKTKNSQLLKKDFKQMYMSINKQTKKRSKIATK